MIPVISFVGYANSGKTTVLTQFVRELRARGYRIAVVKHDVHGFSLDAPGKDTWNHAEAGADIVCISSAHRFAMLESRQSELALTDLLKRINGVDIIFTEGYKQEDQPKIEVFRQAAGHPPLGLRPGLLAVVADAPLYPGIRRFSMEQTALLTDFLEDRYLADMSDRNI